MKKNCAYLFCLMLFVLGCAPLDYSTIRGPFLRPSDIVGSWIGYDENFLSFYRLTFAEGGSGRGVVVFFDDSSASYRIENWKITDRGSSLSLNIAPSTTNAEPIILKVDSVNHHQICLHAKGVERDWIRKVTLYNEAEFVDRAKLCEKIAEGERSRDKR